MQPDQSNITNLLRAWSSGDKDAGEKLWPVLFGELKRMAHRQILGESPGHTLQSGALVNELYLRLTDWGNTQWQNRAQFFAMCARMMRQILVDHARARRTHKRGGDAPRVALDEMRLFSDPTGARLLELDEALKRLEKIHPRKSEVVEMRFFGGLSVDETAEVLHVSRLTVLRDWKFSRAWLLCVLNGENVFEDNSG